MGIKQIAKLANVSIGTVDRVIHKRPGVSKKTEAKVLKIIKETGYVKNTTASRLKLASSKKIKFAILLPETGESWDYWNLPKQGVINAVNELKELGVIAKYYDFTDSKTFFLKVSEILSIDYEAIITVPFFKKESDALLLQSSEKNLPVIFLDTEISLSKNAFFIRQNSNQAGKVAARLLQGLCGNNAEYMIINKRNDQGILVNNIQRQEGFIEYFKNKQSKNNISSESFFLEDDFNFPKSVIKKLNTSKPIGIFVTNSKSHLVLNALKNLNTENIFIVGFDLNQKNMDLLKKNKINFLINQKPELQGYLAIKKLYNLITKPQETDLNYNIPIEITIKENLTTS